MTVREVRVHSTLAGKLVPLEPRVPPRISLFVCGITPYKPSHIGHARTMVFFDVVARFLSHLGYHVFYLQNVTDVEDKILRQATEEGVDPKLVSERNFTDYLGEMNALGVRSVNLYARCSDYIPEIIAQIETLIAKGHAYASEGDVYYSVGTFPTYGRLSGQRTEELQPGARVEINPKKRAPEDFALWKSERMGPTWESPWGKGRPGWHIEDTAITVNVLGPSYDIHGGASELKFPHHEAEIAQAEAATGQSPLARIWMHTGLLNMHGEKMSKSLGNVLPTGEALRIARPDVLRFYFMSAHYRAPLEFTGPASFEEAERAYQTLEGTYQRLREAAARLAPSAPADRGAEATPSWLDQVRHVEKTRVPDLAHDRGDQVTEAMVASLCNDFSIREATASLFAWSSEVNSRLAAEGDRLTFEEVVALMGPFRFAENVLGLFSHLGGTGNNTTLSKLVEMALEARTRARARKDYAEADRIRDELHAAGIQVEDSGGKVRWTVRP